MTPGFAAARREEVSQLATQLGDAAGRVTNDCICICNLCLYLYLYLDLYLDVLFCIWIYYFVF